ncbi:MAG TPA: alpha/beta fold hydrolase [Allosphingosinicella sp.]|nr:alpha/beta fold hydrolase [Allosphingosinicella sp.]
MASSPTSPRRESFTSFDGVELVWFELGQGRPVVLLHGLFSNAHTNWIKFGHAAEIAGRGFRVIMPDLRAHGASAAPHDPSLYPPDVLVRDAEALVAHLDLRDFDLGGFSLGARTVASMLIRGASPRRAVLAGMGLEGLTGWTRRRDFFIESIDRRREVSHGDRHWLAVQFMKTMKIDAAAARLLLASPTDIEAGKLAAVGVPTLVLCGSEDQDNGSAEALAAAIPGARFVEVPGTHMSSVTRPELGRAIADFLAA